MYGKSFDGFNVLCFEDYCQFFFGFEPNFNNEEN
jgi:hypothetical protein